MLYRLVVLSIALIVSQATGFALLPRVTSFADTKNALQEAPKPTTAPIIAKAGLKRNDDIVARALTATGRTCGFVNGDASNSVTCEEGYSCFFWPAYVLKQPKGAVDCWPAHPSSSNIVSTSFLPAVDCVDYNRRYNTDSLGTIISETLYCGYEGQKCATYSWAEAPKAFFAGLPESSSIAAQPYTGLACRDEPTTEFVYLTPTNKLSSSSPTSDSSNALPSPNTSTTSSVTSSSSSTTPTPPPKSSNNVGIIAGTTVGGVVAIAAISGTVVYLVLRKRGSRIMPAEEVPTREVSTYYPNKW